MRNTMSTRVRDIEAEFDRWWASLSSKVWVVEYRVLQQFVGNPGSLAARAFMSEQEADSFLATARVLKVSGPAEATVTRGSVQPERWAAAIHDSLQQWHEREMDRIRAKERRERNKAARAKKAQQKAMEAAKSGQSGDMAAALAADLDRIKRKKKRGNR